MSDRTRWSVGFGTALWLVASGLLLTRTILVIAAVLPLVYLFHGVVSSLPEDVALSADREFDAEGATPGSEVTVTLTVRNTGSDVLPDVRVIDGIPDELTVVAGEPRLGVALSPGDRVIATYTVALERGRFEFDDPVVRLRSMAGTDQRTETIQTDGESTLACADTVSRPPLADAALAQAGTVPATTGGPGLEFYATRQYHPGDPMNRIDWHNVAKTGEFVTIQYRRERAVRTVIVVDCRPCTRVSYEVGHPTGAAMAAYAAERLFRTLDAAGVFTNLTAVGLDDELDHLTGADGLPWLYPGSDGQQSPTTLFQGIHQIAADPTEANTSNRESTASAEIVKRSENGHRDQQIADKETDYQTATATPDGGTHSDYPSRWTETLLARLPADTQVILCSPVLDDWPVEFTAKLTDREYVVISPDVTVGSSYGQRIGGINRRRHLQIIERNGAQVANWRIDEPIEGTLKRALPELFTQR